MVRSPGRPPAFAIRNVAVIGAGPCGLAAAKYLVAQGAFEKVVVFEQQSEVGGVWNYSQEPTHTLHVPQVSAFCAQDPPIHGDSVAPIFPTPMYDHMHTNIPGSLMEFSDLAFPEGDEVFPSRQAVQKYLVQYSSDVRFLIKFCTKVQDIRLKQVEGRDCWDVNAKSTTSGETSTETFDAIVVAAGHYSVSFMPDIRNIGAFHAAHPGVISHAKLYRGPQPYAGKKVLVVGNAASGLDISAQISRFCRKPLLLSVHSPTPPDNLAFIGAEEVPVIEEFLVGERGVQFCGGRVESGIDAILFCTGYLFTFPFLTSLTPPLVTNGRRVHGLYRDLFHIEHPSLVFTGLPIKVVPFPLAESQAALFSRTWANLISLPSVQEMKGWEEEEAQRRGPSFHVYPKGGDVDFINGTYESLMRSGTTGKAPPQWDDWRVWQRRIYFEAKLRFDQHEQKAKSLGELGFHYEPGTIVSSESQEKNMPQVGG